MLKHELRSELEKEIERRVAAMSEDERDHLRTVMYEFVLCYDTAGDDCAVVLFGTKDKLDNVITMNCSGMSAANIMNEAYDFFGYLNTEGAPPKQMFN